MTFAFIVLLGYYLLGYGVLVWAAAENVRDVKGQKLIDNMILSAAGLMIHTSSLLLLIAALLWGIARGQ